MTAQSGSLASEGIPEPPHRKRAGFHLQTHPAVFNSKCIKAPCLLTNADTSHNSDTILESTCCPKKSRHFPRSLRVQYLALLCSGGWSQNPAPCYLSNKGSRGTFRKITQSSWTETAEGVRPDPVCQKSCLNSQHTPTHHRQLKTMHRASVT